MSSNNHDQSEHNYLANIMIFVCYSYLIKYHGIYILHICLCHSNFCMISFFVQGPYKSEDARQKLNMIYNILFIKIDVTMK